MPDSSGPNKLPPRLIEERVAALEAKVWKGKWWQDHGWWGVIFSAAAVCFTIVWQTEAWKLAREDHASVRLIDDHASAYAKNQWDADLRVVNDTSHDIVVERVTAIFGKRRYGQSCRRRGKATRVLYPVSQLQARSPRSAFQRIRPGEGAPFKGGPNVDRVFGAQPCPLAVEKLRSPRDEVSFTVFTNDGAEWRTRGALFYQPRARVDDGGGGLPCGLLLLPFC